MASAVPSALNEYTASAAEVCSFSHLIQSNHGGMFRSSLASRYLGRFQSYFSYRIDLRSQSSDFSRSRLALTILSKPQM
jgi:hypothetical protein